MIVRPIETSDIPALIHLGGMMHEESSMQMLSYSPKKVAITSYQVIESPESGRFCVVAVDNGRIVGMMSCFVEAPCYSDDLVAWDEACYLLPEYRGSGIFLVMVGEYVKWAESVGAKVAFLTHSSGVNHERISKAYEKMGFARTGSVHRMEVSHGWSAQSQKAA